MDTEAMNSNVGSNIGLIIPRPPNHAGRAKRLRLRVLGGVLPVRVGIRLHQIQSSSGLRRSSMLGVVLHRNENLCM